MFPTRLGDRQTPLWTPVQLNHDLRISKLLVLRLYLLFHNKDKRALSTSPDPERQPVIDFKHGKRARTTSPAHEGQPHDGPTGMTFYDKNALPHLQREWPKAAAVNSSQTFHGLEALPRELQIQIWEEYFHKVYYPVHELLRGSSSSLLIYTQTHGKFGHACSCKLCKTMIPKSHHVAIRLSHQNVIWVDVSEVKNLEPKLVMMRFCTTAQMVALRYWRMRVGDDGDPRTTFTFAPYVATVERNCKALKEKLMDALEELLQLEASA